MLTNAEIARLSKSQIDQYTAGDAAYRARFEVAMRQHFAREDEIYTDGRKSVFTVFAFFGLICVAFLLGYAEIIRELPEDGFPVGLMFYRPMAQAGAAYLFPITVLLFIGGAVDKHLRDITAVLKAGKGK